MLRVSPESRGMNTELVFRVFECVTACGEIRLNALVSHHDTWNV